MLTSILDFQKCQTPEANDPSKAIEITVKITSSMIHPNADT